MADQPYQSSYRRHRPQRFGDVRGQQHVTTALRNAIANDRVGHAFLFSGPRGTGKTSTARILAAALNCDKPVDGEPDGMCDSCVAIRAGSSLDVVELDAASNNGVDAMRDLVSRAALGSPGRWKVYIIDEVHMLSAAASNALLKTLEEPPGHVIFVLATTDAQKVLATIRSRTQHYEFRLMSEDVLAGLVAEINDQDGLGLDPTSIDRVVRRGNGSARDALSALDQAAAAGVAEEDVESVPVIVEALAARDSGQALVAVAAAASRGRDPERLALEVAEYLRGSFLLTMAPDLAGVPAAQRQDREDQARRLGAPAIVRALEVLGETLVAMRDALDTRVTLELTLVRLCAPAADVSPAAMLERLERLERRVAAGAAGAPAPDSPAPHGAGVNPTPASVPGQEPRPTAGPPPLPAGAPAVPRARPTIGAVRRGSAPAPEQAAPADAPPGSSAPAVAVTRDQLTKDWGDHIFPSLSVGARAVVRVGRWVSAGPGEPAIFVLPSLYVERGEEKRREIEDALAAHYGGRVPVRIVVEGTEPAGGDAGSTAGPPPAATPAPAPDIDEEPSPAEFAAFEPAPDAPASHEAKILEVFPGTEEVLG